MVGYGARFGGAPGFWWLIGLVCMIVLVVAIAWVIAMLIRGTRHTPPQTWQPPYQGVAPTPPAPPRATPYEVLRDRLARGEITVEDYQRTVAALGPEQVQPPYPQQPQPPQQSL